MQTIEGLAEQFYTHTHLPSSKSGRPYIVVLIGQIGSGKSTLGRMLTELLPGSVSIQPDSARFLLKEADMPWGSNVGAILSLVRERLLREGYIVIQAGGSAEEKDRQSIIGQATQLGVPFFFILVKTTSDVSRQRIDKKYGNEGWISTFNDFRVNTKEKMLANIESRAKVHAEIDPSTIPNLIGEIDNNGSIEELKIQLGQLHIAEKFPR